MGDDQFLYVEKLGVVEYQTILNTDAKEVSVKDIYKNGSEIIKKCVVEWENFADEDGNEVIFTKEALESFVGKCSAVELSEILDKVLGVLEPKQEDIKKVKKLNKDIKN